MLFDLFPINHIPNCLQVLWSSILIFEIIRMLPYIYAQNRFALYLCHIHEWVVLVGGRCYFKLPIFCNKPGPAATKSCCAGISEFFLETVKRSKRGVYGVSQFSGWVTSRICRKDLPEKTMIPVTASVVADCRRNFSC